MQPEVVTEVFFEETWERQGRFWSFGPDSFFKLATHALFLHCALKRGGLFAFNCFVSDAIVVVFQMSLTFVELIGCVYTCVPRL